MTRERSEYRTTQLHDLAKVDPTALARPADVSASDLAVLMLDAYRGTTDDEGEDLADAREAIDHYLDTMVADASFVVTDAGRPVAFSFVVVVDGRRYIDPVVVASDRKRRGVGRSAVIASLQALATDGVTEVGATITDGNVPSERLFASLGFVRVGSW
ncbi:MAG: GNAT family N-acetyltransferase [Ilumatobacteraceae bacterium]